MLSDYQSGQVRRLQSLFLSQIVVNRLFCSGKHHSSCCVMSSSFVPTFSNDSSWYRKFWMGKYLTWKSPESFEVNWTTNFLWWKRGFLNRVSFSTRPDTVEERNIDACSVWTTKMGLKKWKIENLLNLLKNILKMEENVPKSKLRV